MSQKPYKGKRVLDVTVLFLAAVPAAIVGAVCAVAVKATSKGPVFFKQVRSGLNGQPFEVWKFRTMADEPNPIVPDATKITSVGAVLRRFSLDELPQLINVALGDMSIVGPRPTLPYQVERYDQRQMGRLSVKPGLTGLAQVSGRNGLPWAERIDFDLEYVRTQSIRTDLSLILRTFSTVATGDGVEGHSEEDPFVRTDEDPK